MINLYFNRNCDRTIEKPNKRNFVILFQIYGIKPSLTLNLIKKIKQYLTTLGSIELPTVTLKV